LAVANLFGAREMAYGINTNAIDAKYLPLSYDKSFCSPKISDKLRAVDSLKQRSCISIDRIFREI